jgi:hypothetical protein
LRQYNEEIDNTIIEILYQEGERTFGKLKKDLEKSIKHTLSFETYSFRVNAMSKPYRKESRYAICPVLNKRDEGRGKNVFYTLTRNAKTRCDLALPILKTNSIIEKAYRLLFYYITFFYNKTRKLKDEKDYNDLLEKLRISKNELEYQGRAIFKDNFYQLTQWIHAQSEIRFTRKDYLNGSRKEEQYEYEYMLPGISPSEFRTNRESGHIYQHINFSKGEVIQYFKLLENQNLIRKIKSLQLEILNEARYTIVDNLLIELLADCSTLATHVNIYLEYTWKGIRKPKSNEILWYQELWGKSRSNKWFVQCNNIRREYQKKNKNKVLKETQERIDWDKSEIIKKFGSLNKNHTKTIYDYSFFIDPLLNVVYPFFLRKEFNQ